MDRGIQVAFGDQEIHEAYLRLKDGKGEEQSLYRLIESAIN